MTFETRIASTMADATTARAWLRERLAALTTDDPAFVPDILLVFGELVTNSVRHAYGAGATGSIDITLAISDQWLELSIRDYGRSMDLSKYRAPDLSTPHEGGYGIHLIRRLTDEFRIETPEGGGNRFIVRRRFAVAAQGGASRAGSEER